MADIAFTAANIRPLVPNGAVLALHKAGGTITVGHLVYVAADGDVEQADANAGTPAQQAIGIAIQSYDGETTITAGNPVSVCVIGPVGGYSGMTPGDILYVSDTVGRINDAPGTYTRIIGRAESASVIWVEIELSEAAS